MIETNLDNKIKEISTQAAEAVYARLATKFGLAENARHTHNGKDSEFIPFTSIHPFTEHVYFTIPGTSAATAANYGVFWIAPAKCIVKGFSEVHQTAGSGGGTVTLQLEKLTSTQAPDAGVTLLTTALSLKATANTVQTGTIVKTTTSSKNNVALLAGDRLCLQDSGTLTSIANVTVAVLITYP